MSKKNSLNPSDFETFGSSDKVLKEARRLLSLTMPTANPSDHMLKLATSVSNLLVVIDDLQTEHKSALQAAERRGILRARKVASKQRLYENSARAVGACLLAIDELLEE